MVLNNPLFVARNSRSGYQIEQSLRLNSADSYTFRRTPGSDSTSQKKFTVSVWSKRGVIASGTTNNSGRQMIVYTGLSNGSGNLFGLEWRDDEIACIFNGAGSIYPQTVAKFRDPSAWYHIVVAVDTDQGTDTDRCKIYVNGVQQTLTGTLPTSGFLVTNGTTSVHSVGELGSLRSNQYLAELYYINDQQLTPSDFGKTNASGVWVPKKYAGTFTGTNSLYLKFDPSATNGIGHDYSGNGNNLSDTNISTSGTGTDVMSDTPTNNFATLNPVYPENITLTDGNLYFTPSITNWATTRSTIGVTGSGKYYCEMKLTSFSGGCRLCLTGRQDNNRIDTNSVEYTSNGSITKDGSYVNQSVASWGAGDVIAMAINMDAGSVAFYKNGSLQDTATGLDTDLTWWPMVDAYGTSTYGTFNFGQRAFEQTPPTGFDNAICTDNLPAPTVKDGSKNFNTVLYAGNQTSQSITGFGFQPDWAWVKKRNGFQDHEIQDAVRGATKSISSSLSSVETTDSQSITSFTSDGFDIGSSNSVNENRNYVAWAWKANGSGSSIAAGSIDGTNPTIASTVSANTTAGFSIVSFTGTGNAATIAHGLGVKPGLVIGKDRDRDVEWKVYFPILGNYVELSSTAAQSSVSNAFTGATSSVLNLQGTGYGLNYSGDKSIVYCFSEVEGYSKFGSYTGNGSTDGPFVYCGFKPAFLLIKSSSAVANWAMLDNTRNTSNLVNNQLFSNLGNSEYANYAFGDLVSNGFKIRDNSSGLQGNYNTSSATYVFAAFAENPFGGSGVSPATAR